MKPIILGKICIFVFALQSVSELFGNLGNTLVYSVHIYCRLQHFTRVILPSRCCLSPKVFLKLDQASKEGGGLDGVIVLVPSLWVPVLVAGWLLATTTPH